MQSRNEECEKTAVQVAQNAKRNLAIVSVFFKQHIQTMTHQLRETAAPFAKFVLCGPKHMVMEVVNTRKIQVDCLHDPILNDDNENDDEVVLFEIRSPGAALVYKCYNLQALQNFFLHADTNNYLPDTRVQVSGPDLLRIRNLAVSLVPKVKDLPNPWRFNIPADASMMLDRNELIAQDVRDAGYVSLPLQESLHGVLKNVPDRPDLEGLGVRVLLWVPALSNIHRGFAQQFSWVVIGGDRSWRTDEALLVSDNNIDFGQDFGISADVANGWIRSERLAAVGGQPFLLEHGRGITKSKVLRISGKEIIG